MQLGEGKSLVLSNAWAVIILYFALSFCTPSSRYARYLPSLSLILGDVTGGPPAEPHSFGGGGRRIAWKAQPSSSTGRTKSNLGAISPRSPVQCIQVRLEMSIVKVEVSSCGGANLACNMGCSYSTQSTPPVVSAHHCTDAPPWAAFFIVEPLTLWTHYFIKQIIIISR